MADDTIRPDKLHTAESIRGEAVSIGCLDIEIPQGPVHFHDGPGFMTALSDRPGCDRMVWLLVYDPTQRNGLVAQLDGPAARGIATSLLRLADTIDPQGKN